MKKTTTKIYRIREGKRNLEIIQNSTHSGSTTNKVTYRIENGIKYKSSESSIVEDRTISQSYFSKEGKLKWKDVFDYFENGELKERKTLNSNGEVSYFKNQVLDQNGHLIFANSTNDFSYHSSYVEKSNGKRISSQTTYSKEQPYLATSHRVTIYKETLIETIKEYEEFVDTEEGFHPTQDHVEYQFEYYTNGNKKRNIVYSFWKNIEDGEVKTGRHLSKQEDFNEQGLLLKEMQGNQSGEIITLKTYEYEFNENSVWIKRKCFYKGELFEIAEREIEE